MSPCPHLPPSTQANPNKTEQVARSHLTTSGAKRATTPAQAQAPATTTAPNYETTNLAIDNLNVIYDNDTTIVELATAPHAKQRPSTSGGAGTPNSFVHSESADQVQETSDQFATCLLEPSLAAGSQFHGLVGRLNFWQPIQNRGVTHLVARLRYSIRSPAEPDQSQASSAKAAGPGAPARRRRESFQAPIERAPGDADAHQQQPVEAVGSKLRHCVWLVERAAGLAGCATADGHAHQTDGKLVAELVSTATVSGDRSQVVDVDAELIVAHFNLTGTNSLAGKCLHLSLADGLQPIGVCEVTLSDDLPPATGLDHYPSVSVVQPVREDLLGRRQRNGIVGVERN